MTALVTCFQGFPFHRKIKKICTALKSLLISITKESGGKKGYPDLLARSTQKVLLLSRHRYERKGKKKEETCLVKRNPFSPLILPSFPLCWLKLLFCINKSVLCLKLRTVRRSPGKEASARGPSREKRRERKRIVLSCHHNKLDLRGKQTKEKGSKKRETPIS